MKLVSLFGSVLVCAWLAASASAQGFTFSEQDCPADGPVTAVALSDLNGDGNPDIVAAAVGVNIIISQKEGELQIFMAHSGQFTSVHKEFLGTMFNVGIPQGVLALALADLNNDKKIDAVVIDTVLFNGWSVGTLGDGAGGLSGGNFSVPFGGGSTRELVIGDFNDDGNTDAVVASYPGIISLAYGNGSSGFGAPITYSVPGQSTTSVAIGDFNGDGELDAASGGPQHVTILLGQGALGLAVPPMYSNTLPGASNSAVRITVNDFDKDGKLDVAALDTAGMLFTLLGDGAGQLVINSTNTLPAGGATSLAVADLDGDGYSDAVIGSFSGTSSILLSNGASGGLGPPLSYLSPAVMRPQAVAIGDVNVDGLPDIITGNFTNISVLLNQAPTFNGISSQGSGTYGCSGELTMGASSPPQVNNPNFALTCANAPRSSLGQGIASILDNPSGSDPFGVGVTLYVDIINTPVVTVFDFKSDAGGEAYYKAPLPNIPALAGIALHAQGIWIESASTGQACSPSPLHSSPPTN